VVTAETTDTLLLIGRAGNRTIALPVSAVQRVLPMASLTTLPEARRFAGVLNVHGLNLAVVDPRPLLDVPCVDPQPDQRLVLTQARTRFLVWLDAVERIVSAPTQPAPTDADHRGPMLAPLLATLDGETVPILSPDALDPGASLGHDTDEDLA
jgi:chemotaxis signal transduction protein